MPQGQSDRVRVLIAEDNFLVRMNGVDLLEDAGFTVFEAGNADEAITLPEQAHEVRLLFTDIDMPGTINGLELAELVHRRWPKIRLLVTSGHHDLTHADVPDDGRFVAKPYSNISIVKHVLELLAEP